MTAEIAILNRSAVALAADSALTITVGGTEKIYNTAEKIFEFSRKSPVGLLVYNSMDFMGFPWDVLIRRFRQDKDQKFSTVKHATDAFLDYLAKLPVSNEDEDRHLDRVLTEIFSALFRDYSDAAIRAYSNAPQNKPPNLRAIFHEHVANFKTLFSEDDPVDFFPGETDATFAARYGSVTDAAATNALTGLPLGEPEFKALRELAFAAIKSRVTADGDIGFGDMFTGLVFAGYADGDFFPSMNSVVVDGRFFGRTKSWCTKDASIDRSTQRAVIEPFAQREMVDRFVYGLDKDTEFDLATHIEASSRTLISKIMEFLNKGRTRKLKIPDSLINSLSSAARNDFTETFLDDIKSINLKETFEIVTAMPKAELAQMAEALVSLTSTKRRTSLGSETVGGPVDVAVITRGEGFVWIKRKHYFDPEQNPGFFAKHYGLPKGVSK